MAFVLRSLLLLGLLTAPLLGTDAKTDPAAPSETLPSKPKQVGLKSDELLWAELDAWSMRPTDGNASLNGIIKFTTDEWIGLMKVGETCEIYIVVLALSSDKVIPNAVFALAPGTQEPDLPVKYRLNSEIIDRLENRLLDKRIPYLDSRQQILNQGKAEAYHRTIRFKIDLQEDRKFFETTIRDLVKEVFRQNAPYRFLYSG